MEMVLQLLLLMQVPYHQVGHSRKARQATYQQVARLRLMMMAKAT
jgi:hypothetical protein